MQMLARTGNSVILSGDRHQAGVYHDVESGLREITSSSLNLAFDNRGRAEPDPMRVTDQISTENYGMIDIDWRARQISLSVKASRDGQTLITPVSVPFGAKARRVP